MRMKLTVAQCRPSPAVLNLDQPEEKKNMYFLILVRDCISTTALHHIQNKLANLNVSKMSLHHKSLAFSKQLAYVALSSQHGTIHPVH